MTQKVDYEFKTDKRGREYANRIDIKTGKRKRINVKLAKKRLRDIRYRENRKGKEKELKKKGSDWNEYQKEKNLVKKEKKQSKKEKKEKKETKKTKETKETKKKKGKKIKKQREKQKEKQKEKEEKDIEKETLKRVGVRSRYRFNWKYWEMPICNTPVFIADAQAYDGDHYEQMKEFCNGILEDIEQTNLCPNTSVIGGACIVLYRRKDKKIIKHHGFGDGCIKGVEKGM